LPRFSAQQECIGLRHGLEEVRANVVVPIGVRPATMCKAAFGVFVRTAWGLDDTIQCNEFSND
jgi:hypothetical protein